ncbi:MAG: MotA/TolQ/ExbB proton channel family protein [Pirellulales bacterium]|nr:MotA/TolQ/ExbB proton channel family protein [Pirellulales bacterium]MBX3434042.1 MotA/TolQ/ExbB proton channel family protein [Pirellulales bacterium]
MPDLFTIIGWIVYFVMGVLALWGAYCVIMVWRRVSDTRFVDEEEQAEFLAELEQSLGAKKFDAAVELCEGDRRAMPQLAMFAVANRDLGYARLRRRIGERFQQDVMADIEHRLSWVATVAKSAPMIGLLGTVMGMMGAFAKLGGSEQVDATQMATDIQFALTTTALGLAIAVPLVLATASVNVRIRKMEDLVGVGLGRMFETLRTLLPA